MNSSEKRLAEGILFTDHYQLTMAQVYFKMGLHETPALFEHFFRDYPDYGIHQAGYCVNAGLEWLLDWMENAKFGDEELSYLHALKSGNGKVVFADDFLSWLEHNGNFSKIKLRSIAEGRVVHPYAPINIVEGPLAMAQILETALLNHVNFQTLIATKASRIRETCQGQLVLEFGARRAQHFAANAGARAALIGGADFTSNCGISYVLGMPPKGTHAHSLVQLYMAMGKGELDAFRAYAEVYPSECLLLVDTIDTIESGIPNAITVFDELRAKGFEPIGIRLDSGDLAYLSIKAAMMLDEAGYPNSSITLSNNLDELTIWQIISQIQLEAPRYGMDAVSILKRLAFGVGTKMITSGNASALNGVYKLVGIQCDGEWKPAIKISESAEKTLIPGRKLVWRIYDQRGKATADLMTLDDEDPRKMGDLELYHPTSFGKKRKIRAEEISKIELLHEEVLRGDGSWDVKHPTMEEMRGKRSEDVGFLHLGVKRLMHPHIYHVSLSEKLMKLKLELIENAQ